LKRTHLKILMLPIATWVLAACVRMDVPTRYVSAIPSLHAVRVISASPPYAVVSYSLHHAIAAPEMTHPKALQLVERGHYENWSWTVKATGPVLASWQRWAGSRDAHVCAANAVQPCALLNWNIAFTRLYQTAAFLLGRAPLPLDLNLSLFPDKETFSLRVKRTRRTVVPLVFAFSYPASAKTDSATQFSRLNALVHAVTNTGYEFQHVEYAAGTSKGPQFFGILKNEANSECWRLSAKLVLLAGRPGTVLLPRISRSDMESTAALLGNRLRFSTGSTWGPLLMQRDLARYLEERNPGMARHALTHVSTTNYPIMNQVLAYCRGYTRYPGQIARKPMPNSRVSKQAYWILNDRNTDLKNSSASTPAIRDRERKASRWRARA
jgi:hypothetical protein